MHIETYVNATFEQVRLSVMLIRLWVLGRVFQKVSLCSLWQSRCGCLKHGWSGLSVVDSAVHWAFGPACGRCDGSLELQALDTHCQHLSCFYVVDCFFAWHGKFELCCLMYLYYGFGVLKPDMYRILIGCPDLIVYCLITCRLPAASGKVFMVSLRWPSCGFTAVALFQSARYICVHSCHQQPAYTTLQCCAREKFCNCNLKCTCPLDQFTGADCKSKLMLLDQDFSSLSSAFLLLGQPACAPRGKEEGQLFCRHCQHVIASAGIYNADKCLLSAQAVGSSPANACCLLAVCFAGKSRCQASRLPVLPSPCTFPRHRNIRLSLAAQPWTWPLTHSIVSGLWLIAAAFSQADASRVPDPECTC